MYQRQAYSHAKIRTSDRRVACETPRCYSWTENVDKTCKALPLVCMFCIINNCMAIQLYTDLYSFAAKACMYMCTLNNPTAMQRVNHIGVTRGPKMLIAHLSYQFIFSSLSLIKSTGLYCFCIDPY